MERGMKEDTREELIKAPSFLPRLFFAPSCLPKFAMILEAVAEKKAELLKKTIQLREAMHKKEHERLYNKCFWLRLEMNAFESKAKKMRRELVQRIYVEVSSVKEMKAVNELRLGVGAGATPGMPCFRGKIYVSGNVPKDVIRAMAIVERTRQTF